MERITKGKSAKEIIDQFFSDLADLEGMDQEVAEIIQRLREEGNLGRDELLSALQTARDRGMKKNEKD
jgi:hypothetical protein